MQKVTITKDEIGTLEVECFPGKIHIINSLSQAKTAIIYLRKHKYLGFDTETRPSFKKGALRPMALMQISTHDECFLFRINKIGIPDMLKELLEDENITKIGLSIKDDFGVLRRSTDSTCPEGFIELQTLVKTYGISDISLQKIYAILFDKKISKSQRLSNWEAPELTPAQQEYAAIDAWACLKIYDYLIDNGFNPQSSKYLREIEDPTINTIENETN